MSPALIKKNMHPHLALRVRLSLRERIEVRAQVAGCYIENHGGSSR